MTEKKLPPKKEQEKEPEKKQLSSKELQQLFNRDKTKRAQDCKEEIDEILKKYRCELFATPRYTPEGTTVAVPFIRAISEQ